MACVTTIVPNWIASVAADCPLLKWSAPISSPLPYYDAVTDTVMCFVVPRFGVHVWELPAMRRPLFECTGDDSSANTNSSKSAGGTPLGFRKEDEAYR